MLELTHKPECYAHQFRGYAHRDVTGVLYKYCVVCGSLEHGPLKFGSRESYLGQLSKWPDLEHTPYGHESGQLDFIPSYLTDITFRRIGERKLPAIKNPVPIAFDPSQVILNKDSKRHEGVSFRRIWKDAIARSIWLGHKPFMLTNQYFRRGCVEHAKWLRKHPEYLLGDKVSFCFNFGTDFEWSNAIGGQLTPYLIQALDAEGLWPYFRLPDSQMLTWKIEMGKAA